MVRQLSQDMVNPLTDSPDMEPHLQDSQDMEPHLQDSQDMEPHPLGHTLSQDMDSPHHQVGA